MGKFIKKVKGLAESRTATYLVQDAYSRAAQGRRDRNKFLHNRKLDPKPVKGKHGYKLGKKSVFAW